MKHKVSARRGMLPPSERLRSQLIYYSIVFIVTKRVDGFTKSV